MDEDGKSRENEVDVRQLRNTPVMIEGIVGMATWDGTGDRLCFVPDVNSPGYQEAAARDGDWGQWVIENKVRCTGQLIVLEIIN